MKKDETDFINILAFGKTAETLCQYLKKGDQVALEGRIQTGSYEREGVRIYTTEVVVERFNFIGNNKGEGNKGTQNTGSAGQSNYSDYDDMMPVDDGDVPF